MTCKRDRIKMRDYMDKRVTSPTWGPPPPCKEALSQLINRNSFILPRIQHKFVLLVLPTVFAVCFWLLSYLQLKLWARIPLQITYLCAALVLFLNPVFRQEWFNRFPWFLAFLIKNGRTLRKCYLFSYRYKNVWDIGICLKPHFYKKCQ